MASERDHAFLDLWRTIGEGLRRDDPELRLLGPPLSVPLSQVLASGIALAGLAHLGRGTDVGPGVRAVLSGARRTGAAMGAGFAVKADKLEALAEIGLDRDDIRHLSPRQQTQRIIDRVFGASSDEIDHAFREAASRILLRFLESPTVDVDYGAMIRDAAAEIVYRRALVEISDQLAAGALSNETVKERERQIRDFIRDLLSKWPGMTITDREPTPDECSRAMQEVTAIAINALRSVAGANSSTIPQGSEGKSPDLPLQTGPDAGTGAAMLLEGTTTNKSEVVSTESCVWAPSPGDQAPADFTFGPLVLARGGEHTMVVELLPLGATPTDSGALQLEWPSRSSSKGKVVIGADPFFTRFGSVPDAAIDLARAAVGAYLADHFLPRSSVNWSRDITLIVHMVDPDGFSSGARVLEALLFWVSGDHWSIVPVASSATKPVPPVVAPAKAVALASGGLDSLCGALLAPAGTVFLGQWDSRSVAHAQRLIHEDLGSVVYEQVRVQARNASEPTSRSRSVMFMALGIAIAAARHAEALIVPENGFTSFNPPLAANRGGPRTTRSTHPTTFAYVNELTRVLGLEPHVVNPYEWLTKGELVKLAVGTTGAARLETAIPRTFSCSKGVAQFVKGGSAYLNCGVCVACMTRRGAIRTAGIPDGTKYAVDLLRSPEQELFMKRMGDVEIVRTLKGWHPDDADLIAMGPFPDGFDYDRAKDLLAQGIEELIRGLP